MIKLELECALKKHGWKIYQTDPNLVVHHDKDSFFQDVMLPIVYSDIDGKYVVGNVKGRITYTRDYETLVQLLKELQSVKCTEDKS